MIDLLFLIWSVGFFGVFGWLKYRQLKSLVSRSGEGARASEFARFSYGIFWAGAVWLLGGFVLFFGIARVFRLVGWIR